MATGFAAHALATARVAFAFPTARATSEYERVLPYGMLRSASHTRRWNAVARTSSGSSRVGCRPSRWAVISATRSEEHTSELQSRQYLVCRLLLEKKKKKQKMEYRACSMTH